MNDFQLGMVTAYSFILAFVLGFYIGCGVFLPDEIKENSGGFYSYPRLATVHSHSRWTTSPLPADKEDTPKTIASEHVCSKCDSEDENLADDREAFVTDDTENPEL